MENEEYPLRWPEGWPRTRLQDRKQQSAWKKTYLQSMEALGKELKRLGARVWIITRNRGETQDVGVAVYFSLKPVDQYGWQEALGFIGQVPTVEEISRAYKQRVSKIHPDGPTPDRVLFEALTQHRDRALDWATGKQKTEYDKVLACDSYNEVRLNVNAVRLTIAALRQIERCGASMMMERAFRGFSKQITAGASSNDSAA